LIFFDAAQKAGTTGGIMVIHGIVTVPPANKSENHKNHYTQNNRQATFAKLSRTPQRAVLGVT